MAKKRWKFLRTLFTFLVAIGLGLFVRQSIAQPVQVVGVSMESALANGEILLADRLTCTLQGPKCGDIIVFAREDVYYVKRVIALPGQSVGITHGTVSVNGVPLSEPYLNTPTTQGEVSLTLGENEYFVLGDNRPLSADSRSAQIGTVQKEEIIGIARCVLWPMENIRLLENQPQE